MKIRGIGIVLLGIGIVCQVAAGEVNVIMTGLDNPRGLTLGPDGGVYVAEAGRGGTGTEIIGGEGAPVRFGSSGAVSRFLNGAQARVVVGLPSLAAQVAPTAGNRANGLTDILFSGGDLYGVIGFGGNPANRALLSADSSILSHVVRLPIGGGAPVDIADIGAHEATANPDGGLPDTNAYGLMKTATGFVAADAGANAVFNVTSAGVVSTNSVFAARPNPLPFGPPVFQAVPTSVATGPDGALYVGQLTGFPFPPGAANVYRIDGAGAQTIAASGFTNIIDVDFGPDGDMFVLQLTTNGIAAATPGAGRLLRIDSETGLRTVVLEDPLVFPGGVLITPDYKIFVSNFGTSAGGGQVLEVVPEPAAFGLIGIGLALFSMSRRRGNK